MRIVTNRAEIMGPHRRRGNFSLFRLLLFLTCSRRAMERVALVILVPYTP